tara:strand:- start:124727 stop:126439 length:1713 start_codon:yes stop_codon:yes gene_type:complete
VQTADEAQASEPAESAPLLGAKAKTLADLAASPAAERRPAADPTPAPAGTEDRRASTATPRDRGRTMPPIPSRTERDRIASQTKGVAPGLAREATPLPQQAKPSPPPPVPAKPKPKPVVEQNNSEDGWPAPSRMPASHPDDWNLEAPAQALAQTELAVPAVHQEDDAVAPASPAAAAPAAPAAAAPAAPAPAAAPAPPAADSWDQTPPPSAIPAARPMALSEPFKAADVAPVPQVPEAGLLSAVKYTVSFARARWQRRGAIGDYRDQISKDTGILDGILGTLGRQTRSLGLENKALEAENNAIDGAEDRRKTAEHACSELSNRQAEENSKFADSEAERLEKVADADRALDIANTDHGAIEAQRRDLRDQRKTIENRQKGYLKAADSRDSESEKQDERDKREELRAAATTLRRDAEQLSEERKDIDRRYDALEQPLAQLSSRVDALKSDRDAAKRNLTDLREGHRHRLAEIDAEQGRKSRELAQAEAEIERRYVTLGTLVNLNRIDRHEFAGIYEQIDTLRGAIGARSNEIDKLSAERQAFDKASLIRGACVLGGGFLLFLALLAIVLTAT